MVGTKAATVEQYLAELPPERAEVVRAVRGVILQRLPEGYEETMNWGMISYEIPLARYPNTYNGQPLGVLALAAQSRYYSLYLSAAYASPDLLARLRAAYDEAGIRFDMGKSCLRFRNLAGIDLQSVGDVIAAVPPERYIAVYEAAQASRAT